MKITIQTDPPDIIEFPIGAIVYHCCNDDGIRGIITGITIRPNGVVYGVTWGESMAESSHLAIELSDAKVTA